MFKTQILRLSSNSRFCSSIAVKQLNQKIDKPVPLITCMRTQFNLFWEQDVPKSKSGEILLASAAWQHYKSKGDHFIIHPIKELASDMSEKSFEELNIDEKIIANIKQQDIIKQTKVQEQAIPLIMKNEHVLLAAETGSGKTHTFLVPIIQRILGMKHKVNREFNTPLALIITPGRELATQIGHMAEALCDGLGLNVKVVLGGRTKQQMLNPSFEDIDILIGSLGGISKLTTTGIYHMKEVRHVVLDESDTLLDDSFMEKLSYFLRRFPFHRNLLNSDSQVGTQLILASATMPTNTEELFQSIIDPETIKTVVSQNLHRILPNVTQKFLRTNKADRPSHLLRIVKQELQKKRPIIVFGNKSVTSDYISIFLNNNGVNCINLNGDMLHQIRLGRFEQFQNGSVDVLSTTDIGSRGLNTTRVRHVINFDFPIHSADYIHRCGRVGRLGSQSNCFVTNFISSQSEIDLVKQIEYSVRTQSLLKNVDANITNIINKNIEKEIKKYENSM